MDFVGAIKSGFSNYANFRGAASRSEFWYWTLFTVLATIVASSVDRFLFGSLSTIFSFATLIPSLAVSVRRLRDAGFLWVWMLSVIPGFAMIVGGITGILILLFNSGIVTDFAGLDDESFFQTQAFLAFVSTAEVVGYAFLTFFGMILYLIAALVLLVFSVLPSKTYEQGNKRLKPATPVI
jgi:uncharacterized membrane protein YhaH (DUF805 family)